MDYKEKLKEALNSDNTDYEVVRWIEKNFPELKESEDERIRKALISILKSDFEKDTTIYDISVGDIIAWLEKQGEQKPADKVEPKFKVGDKIVEDNEFGMVGGEITDIDDTHYELDGGGRYIPISHQDNYKLVEEQKPS